MKKTKLVLVDAPALMHRAFHAIPHLTTKTGEPVNAVYGFCMIFLNMLKDLNPDYVVTTFDLKEPTFRHKEFKEYKAKRVKAPQEFYDQIPKIKEIIEALNIPIFEQAGYEADDLIGTIATKSQNLVDEIMIVTGDLDTLQLVNDKTKIYTLRKGLSDTAIYDEDYIMERFGLKASQMNDYKGLRGDASDNIPGITGIGEKTASELIAKYGSIEKIFSHLSELSERQQKLFKDKEKEAEFSKMLVTIKTDVPVKFDLEKSRLLDFDRAKVVKIFQELEFKSLLTKIPGAVQVGQANLFDKPKEESEEIIKLNADYKTIRTETEIRELVKNLEKQSEIVVDTETDCLDAISGNIIGISLSFKEKQAFYIPLGKNPEPILKKFKPILENSKIEKIGHNLKYDYMILSRYGIKINPISFDTMIASYLLNPNTRSHNLDQVSFVELGYEKIPIENLIGKGAKQISLKDVDVNKVSQYSCEDSDITYRLYKHFKSQLTGDLQKLFYEIEMPLAKVLAEMELAGIKLDSNHLKNLSKQVTQKISELTKKIYDSAGEEFNINSTQQLKQILFEKLKISNLDVKKTKTGFSTAASELEKLKGRHKIIDYISEYRELNKLKNTYIDALPKIVNPQTGRLHTSFNQTITTTGRLSSSNPNLQNIPIRTELGQEIRKAFVADKGYKLLSADYSQIELRIMAHLSKDKKMVDAFLHNEDIHSATASEIFDVPLEKVTKKMRRIAKTVNFGVLYGISPYGLSQGLKIDVEKARTFIDNYFNDFSGVRQYLDNTIADATEKGFVETLSGRRRYLPDIHSGMPQVKNAAERMAINMPCQGTAADIVKMAMVEIQKQVNSKQVTDNSKNAKLLLQVHDELVFEVPDNEVEKFSKTIKEIMENIFRLDVPLKVDIKVGNNWQEMEKVQLD